MKQDVVGAEYSCHQVGDYLRFLKTQLALTPFRPMIEGKKFFAIRGYIKSGTNWLGRILNLHPDISCVGEFHWNRISAQLIQTYSESQNLFAQPDLMDRTWQPLDRFIKEAMVLACDPEATWIGDRTPSHIEPSVILGARVFNLVRDGRDILISAAYHYFNKPEMYPMFDGNQALQDRLLRFRSDPEFFRKNPTELLDCPELIKEFAFHWAETVNVNRQRIEGNPQMVAMEIRYEDLHRDTETERRKLYEFLDVDPNLAGKLAHNTKAGFKEERPNQFLRKGSVGDWQNYFTPRAKAVFDLVAGKTLERYGYVESQDWQVALNDDGSRVPGFKAPAIRKLEPLAKVVSPEKQVPDPELVSSDSVNLPSLKPENKKASNGYLDAINHENDSMIVQGWMMLEDGAPDSVALVSPTGDVVEASRCDRPDLVSAYPNDPSAKTAGYEAIVPRAKFLRNNGYEFCIVARRGDVVAFECQVVKRRADLEGLTAGPYATNEGTLII